MPTRMVNAGAIALLLALAACGGSSSSTGGAGGSSSQLAFLIPATSCSTAGQGVSLAGVAVGIADRAIAGACSAISTGCTDYKNLATIFLAVQNFNAAGGTAAAVVPGTYTVGGTPTSTTGTLAIAGRDTTDASCNSTGSSTTSTGTITISSISSSAVAGSYAVTIGGTAYSGSFNAPLCSVNFGGDICSGKTTGNCTTTPQCI